LNFEDAAFFCLLTWAVDIINHTKIANLQNKKKPAPTTDHLLLPAIIS